MVSFVCVFWVFVLIHIKENHNFPLFKFKEYETFLKIENLIGCIKSKQQDVDRLDKSNSFLIIS